MGVVSGSVKQGTLLGSLDAGSHLCADFKNNKVFAPLKGE